MPSPRRFPPPWTIEELNDACFVVSDNAEQKLACLLRGRDWAQISGQANDAPHGGRGCGFKCRMTLPSEMVGLAAPVSRAFLAIQSRAARMLSSVPALSRQTVTENPPLEVRTSE